MRRTEELYELAEEERIRVQFRSLSPFNGLYVREPDIPPTILLDHSLLRQERTLRAVFAEELGHHFTTTGDWIALPSTYHERIHRSRVELRAIRWAVDYMVDGLELVRVWRRYQNLWEVADWFFVPVPWVAEKLQWVWGKMLAR